MAVKQVLLLGNPLLYKASRPVKEEELDVMQGVVADLHDTLMAFRQQYGFGRAIAAPQIGVKKRVLYMSINDVSTVFVNPRLEDKSAEMMEVWDDCMCFPDLLVKVMRHKSCRIRYRDRDWRDETMMLDDDLSELLQHEYDHLDGVLAVSRAIDDKSFALMSQKGLLKTK
jgi:peptide deformylase